MRLCLPAPLGPMSAVMVPPASSPDCGCRISLTRHSRRNFTPSNRHWYSFIVYLRSDHCNRMLEVGVGVVDVVMVTFCSGGLDGMHGRGLSEGKNALFVTPSSESKAMRYLPTGKVS